MENSYNEGGVDGAEAAGPFRDSVPRSRHIANLLINPHSAIRRQTCTASNYEKTKRMKYMAGEKWWGLEEESRGATTALVAHPPLLDEGEGKLSPTNVSNKLSALNGGGGTDRSDHSPPTLECKGGEVSIADTPQIEGAETDLAGLNPPKLDRTGGEVTGADTPQHRIENKRRRKAQLARQPLRTKWTTYTGEFELPDPHPTLSEHRGGMCPSGLALHHPAAPLLKEWATYGCPTQTGRPWTTAEMQEAIDRGPHRSALSKEAIAHFKAEVDEKVMSGQAKLVSWDAIKANPPENLKISPIAAIPHKSKQFRSILDLSFHLRLKQGGVLPSVNSTTVKTAPKGAIDQLGHSLSRIIHAFAETDDDAVIFMAKWDIKDGFWRLDAGEGAEYNFSYVMPQPPGSPTMLVVPTSLQMGWVESPPYFCAASETARDIAGDYCDTGIGTLPDHKFLPYAIGNPAYQSLPESTSGDIPLRYLLEVYVDDFVSLVIPASREHLRHVSNGTMMAIHDIFPPDEIDSNDPISEKKLKQGDGEYATTKTVLGFELDGIAKTIWLEEAKRAYLLTVLKGWVRSAQSSTIGIEFKDFESIVAKIRHAFTAIPAGRGLLSPCNKILQKKPRTVYLHRNPVLLAALSGCRTLLRESSDSPTRCKELVGGWPDYIGVCDASSHGVGGVVFGEKSTCTPTVFRWEWSPEVKAEYRKKSITNSDLEMAGLLFLWLVMETVCGTLREKRVALFSDNSPTVGWVRRLATRGSLISAHLIRALSLRLKLNGTCPLTPLHIAGEENSMTDIPSRSFGSNNKWHCKNNTELLTLFNSTFPLPGQTSWTVFQLTYAIGMRVTSVLLMSDFTLEEWRRLPRVGKAVGAVGQAMSGLWEWTLTYRTPHLPSASASSLDSQGEFGPATTVEDNKSKLEAFLAQSRPLDRRLLWPRIQTPRK